MTTNPTTPAPLATQIKPAPEVSRHAHTLWRTQSIPDSEGKFHPLSLEQITGAMEAIRREAMGHADEIAKALEVYRLSAQGARANLGEIEEDRRGLLAKVAELEAERDRLKAGCHERDALLKIREDDRTKLAVKLHNAQRERDQQRENARKLQEDLAEVVKELAQVKEHRGQVMAERNRAQERVHELEHPQSTQARALAAAEAERDAAQKSAQLNQEAAAKWERLYELARATIEENQNGPQALAQALARIQAMEHANEVVMDHAKALEHSLEVEKENHCTTLHALNATQDRQGDLELQLKAAINTAANYAAKIAVAAVQRKALEGSIEILAKDATQAREEAKQVKDAGYTFGAGRIKRLEADVERLTDLLHKSTQTTDHWQAEAEEARAAKSKLADEVDTQALRIVNLEAHAKDLQAKIDARYTADRAAEEEALARAEVDRETQARRAAQPILDDLVQKTQDSLYPHDTAAS